MRLYQQNRIIVPQTAMNIRTITHALFSLAGVCCLCSGTLGSPLPITDDAAPVVEETKPLWQTKLEVQETDFIEFLSKDRVLVGTIDTNEMGGGLRPHEIMLLNPLNGEVVWSTPRDPFGSAQSLLAVYPLILIQGSKQLAALDPEKGRALDVRPV